MSDSEARAEGTDRLMRLYERYVGAPDRRSDVYVGFALFFAGIALGAVGVVVFLYSATLPSNELSTYAVREVAVVAAAVGLPALLSAVAVLLPVDRRVLYAAGAGSAVCLAAVGLFVWAYPYNWNVTQSVDYSAQGVAVYSVGLVGVVAATGASLVAHQVERATPAETVDDAAGDETDAEAIEEQARADVERELSDTELSWGGVERTETRRLELDTGDLDEAQVGGLETGATTTRTTSGGVDDAVEGLRGLQGGEAETASGSSVDEQTAALQELKAQREAEREAEPDGPLATVRERLRGLF